MNLFKLRKMASDGDMSVTALRYLLGCHGECEYIDYKEKLNLDTDYDKACFARDVLAMKNVGGGYIVLGVKNQTWEPIGLNQPIKVDTKLLRDLVRKVTGLELEIDIVAHTIPILSEYREFGIVLIRASTKRSKRRVPTACKVSFKPKEEWGLRDGEIYFRKGDQTVRIHDDDLEDLLSDLDEAEDKLALEQQQTEPSPFMIEEGLYRILPPEYETFIDRPHLQKAVQRLIITEDRRIWIINVYGPGGVGKSALVSWLAYHCYETKAFQAILHLSAKETQLSETGITMLRPTLYSLENLIDYILYLFGFEAFINEDLEEKKDLAQTLLSDYSTLIILDNMETLSDARVMQFVRSLPPSNKSMILLTSRLRTSDWEKPLKVDELSLEETKNFLQIKTKEKNIGQIKNFDSVAQQIYASSGGLPLAIEWILGLYAIKGNLDSIINQVRNPDSPLLEFSFNISWSILDEQAQRALAVLSIFEEPPTMRLWVMALGWLTETVEYKASLLIEATFVSERIDEKTGEKTYHMLPITSAFARNKLAQMGNLEVSARTAYKRYLQQMELVAEETQQFNAIFDSFNVHRDTEKQAIILASKAQMQASSFNYDDTEKLYKEALEIDPRSVFVLMSYGKFKSERDQIGEAIELLEKATQYINKNTGFSVYWELSQVYDKIKDRRKVETYLKKALEYQPNNRFARHRLGVVMSRLGRYNDAIKIFDGLIQEELSRENGPTDTLVYSYKSKYQTLQKDKQAEKARKVREEAADELKRWPYLANKAYEFYELE